MDTQTSRMIETIEAFGAKDTPCECLFCLQWSKGHSEINSPLRQVKIFETIAINYTSSLIIKLGRTSNYHVNMGISSGGFDLDQAFNILLPLHHSHHHHPRRRHSLVKKS